MGWSLSWAAVKGGDVQTVCSLLGLRQTGQRERITKSKIAGTALPVGWYVVVFNRTEIKDSILEKLSQAGEVIGCFVEDHVMFSSAAGWKDGKQVWRAFHKGEEGDVLHLETSGQLPPEFEDIRKKVFAEQEQENAGHKEVDYVFELPAELAKKLTGFRHDQGTSGNAYEGLESAIGGENSLLARIATTLEGSSTSSIVGLVALMILFSPVLLVAALIAVPWILTTRLIGRLAQKRR
jgi:hypothetical protein